MSLLFIRGIDLYDTRELEILVDGEGLCVANAWNWGSNHKRPELFRIYHKRTGLPVGPHYVSLTLADHALRSLLKIPNAKQVWSEDLAFFHANRWVKAWVDQNIGRAGDLVGGEWVDEKGKPVRS